MRKNTATPTSAPSRRNKGMPTAPRREGAGASVRLGRRTRPGSPLRIGAVSWGDGSGRQSPDEFLETLAAAAKGRGECDLAVTAGLTVASVPSAEAVLSASGGAPVLFEVEGESGERPWLLAHGGSRQFAVLRNRQLAQRFDDHDGFRMVAGAVARGAGVVEFEGVNLRFVLFICGENNSVAPYAARSVFKNPPEGVGEAAQLREVLAGPWVMLNPAHAAYFPHALPTGFGKVGVAQKGQGRTAGPTLRWLAERTDGYRDGTTAPVAVIHVNNYDPVNPATAEYAAVAFGDSRTRVLRASGPTSGEIPVSPPHKRPWRACVYEVITKPLCDLGRPH